MKKYTYSGLLLVLMGLGYWQSKQTNFLTEPSSQTAPSNALVTAFNRQLSNIQIQGLGEVKKILPDDQAGSRHQKFILSTGSQATVLIAHNIDLAPKIEGLSLGDTVEFYGEYEWNAKGGVVHWTHRDPNQQHESGWLKHRGKIYQ